MYQNGHAEGNTLQAANWAETIGRSSYLEYSTGYHCRLFLFIALPAAAVITETADAKIFR